MMKFAKCMYARFMNSAVPDLKLSKGDVFAVIPEIEKERFYQDGINTKNFIPVEINTHAELRKVVNVTDSMKVELTKRLADEKKAILEAKQKAVTEARPKSHPAPDNKSAKPSIPEIDEKPNKLELPDLDKMSYKELQNFAKELEVASGNDINRGASTKKLKAEIKKVYSEMG